MSRPFFLPEEIRMEVANTNGVIFQLRGRGSFVSLYCWSNGTWRSLSVVGNHAPGWRILEDIMKQRTPKSTGDKWRQSMANAKTTSASNKRVTVQDRATVSNMCPEYGATAAFFPVDAQTLRYLRATNRGSSPATSMRAR